jgi:dTDP-3-amino-3,4,6-trideoxy-alpha-D-glucose transaminase
MSERVPFMSLVPAGDDAAIRGAIDRVIKRGWFILGPEVDAFEAEFAAASGTSHAVSVGNGTDALALLLRAMGIGPGDEVVTSPTSAAFSALAIQMAGATPVFADIDPERLTLSPEAAASAITPRTAAIMPVHLYGQPADMPAFLAIARRHNLAIVEDACQAHLATSDGKPVGTYGAGAGVSFYPTKNLGALGDGGAVITSDAALADKLKRLRNGGQSEKYRHVEFGVNSRLDDLQAAILRERLMRLPQWTSRRRALAAAYRRTLANPSVSVPRECDPGHVYHLFPVLVRNRDGFRAHLTSQGVGTLVHYPHSLAAQPAFANAGGGPCPVAERVAREVCSLPLHPHLSDSDQEFVAAAVHSWRG